MHPRQSRRSWRTARPRATNIVARQRAFAGSAEHQTVRFRQNQLRRLRAAITDHRLTLIAALQEDLRKPEIEAYASELSLVVREIEHALRHLRRWMRDRRAGGGAVIETSPLGAALVIGTWNYPVQLTLAPVVAAVAAGNGVTVKPSELAPVTAGAIAAMIESRFSPEEIHVEIGGPETTNALVDAGYDKVFFTGSPGVGALVAARAAALHSNVTLELGGKSPAVVGPKSDIAYTARRIAWGKFINAGQTCMAPDYVLVPEPDAEGLISELGLAVCEFYGADVRTSKDYGRIINEKHFSRLTELAKSASVALDSDKEDRYIAPTIVRAQKDSRLMEEEIFGPILPVISYATAEEAIAIAGRHPNPLAVYVFSNDRQFVREMLLGIPSGGAMINDVVLHTTNPRLPFGGRGSSGTGSYHGRFGYEAFSHSRGIARKRQLLRGSLRFPPYRQLPATLRRWLFRL